jgi:hypothetical protein
MATQKKGNVLIAAGGLFCDTIEMVQFILPGACED